MAEIVPVCIRVFAVDLGLFNDKVVQPHTLIYDELVLLEWELQWPPKDPPAYVYVAKGTFDVYPAGQEVIIEDVLCSVWFRVVIGCEQELSKCVRRVPNHIIRDFLFIAEHGVALFWVISHSCL